MGLCTAGHAPDRKEGNAMKKWGALLLAAWLGLTCAGVLAETTVTLDVSNNGYNIYPDGYETYGLVWNDNNRYYSKGDTQSWVRSNSNSTHYILTGTSKNVDAVVDFYSEPHQSGSANDVEYNVTFQNLQIESYRYGTAIRFNENKKYGSIELNVTNIGNNRIMAGNSPAFTMYRDFYSWRELIVNITMNCSTNSTLELGRTTIEGYDPKGNIIYLGEVNVNGTLFSKNLDGVIKNNNSNLTINGHTLVEVDEIPATCTETGYKERWTCTHCDKLFSDEYGTKECTQDDLRIPALGHKLKETPENAATCTDDGQRAYWTCERCGKLFGDENGKTPIDAPEVIPALGHKYDAAWNHDKEGHWRICRRPLGTADAARAAGICGAVTAKEPHTFAWVVDKEPGAGTTGERHEACTVCVYRRGAETLPALNLPHTGDSSHLMRWAALLGACCAGLACMARRKRR